MMAAVFDAVEELLSRGGSDGLSISLQLLDHHRPFADVDASPEELQAGGEFMQTLSKLFKHGNSENSWKAANVIACILQRIGESSLQRHGAILWDSISRLLGKNETLPSRVMGAKCLRSIIQREHELQMKNDHDKTSASGQQNATKLMALAIDCMEQVAADVEGQQSLMVDMLNSIHGIVVISSAMGRVGVQKTLRVTNSLLHNENDDIRSAAAKLMSTLPTCVGGGVGENWHALVTAALDGANAVLSICVSSTKSKGKKKKAANVSANSKNIENFYAPVRDWECENTGSLRVVACAKRFQGLCGLLERCLTQGIMGATHASVPVGRIVQLAETALPRNVSVALASPSNPFPELGSPLRYAVLPQLLCSAVTLLVALVQCAGFAVVRNYTLLERFAFRLVDSIQGPFDGPMVRLAAISLLRQLVLAAGPTAHQLVSESALPLAVGELGRLLPPRLLEDTTTVAEVSEAAKAKPKRGGGTSARSTRKRKGMHRTVVTENNRHVPLGDARVLVAAAHLAGSVLLRCGSLLAPDQREGLDWLLLSLLDAGPEASMRVERAVIGRFEGLESALVRCLTHSLVTPVGGAYSAHSFTHAMHALQHTYGDVALAELQALGTRICENQLHPKGAPPEFAPVVLAKQAPRGMKVDEVGVQPKKRPMTTPPAPENGEVDVKRAKLAEGDDEQGADLDEGQSSEEVAMEVSQDKTLNSTNEQAQSAPSPKREIRQEAKKEEKVDTSESLKDAPMNARHEEEGSNSAPNTVEMPVKSSTVNTRTKVLPKKVAEVPVEPSDDSDSDIPSIVDEDSDGET